MADARPEPGAAVALLDAPCARARRPRRARQPRQRGGHGGPRAAVRVWVSEPAKPPPPTWRPDRCVSILQDVDQSLDESVDSDDVDMGRGGRDARGRAPWFHGREG
ncbi:hypothetical protein CAUPRSCDRAFT_12446 [Caulochytrium protostelioides]|uniref:Uncharacterized protein n=1 Tax=Caulochytrium protostelioides TaxID=1555241 RepID=A0A4P9WTU8_9FUNG|nr:hypothetical protein CAUPRSCDRAFT_12446 [Caulochytrium protostelioides]